MAFALLREKGAALDKQKFTWRDLMQAPISKLDDDAFTRIRIILMNGIEEEAKRFSHSFARMCPDPALQKALAQVRRKEVHQQVMINWLLGADHSTLETTIGYEQVAIEVTAAVAQKEPDAYLAQVYRYGLLEDFDHMYRYAALMDRLEGKDANNILQSYTDILPGRPTVDEHRAPEHDVRRPYEKAKAHPLSKLHALTILSGEQQTHNFYVNVGPTYADPVARALYAEIGHIEEQHITHYESIIDPTETWMEKWLMHEACEVYNYYSCVQAETNPRIKAIWERFLDYELGHLQVVAGLFEQHEGRDPAELLPETLPDPIEYRSQRDFVRGVLEKEVDLRADGHDFVDKKDEPKSSLDYRKQMNSEGSPSQAASAGYQWAPGTELKLKVVNL